jgi:hypothetical protein
VPRCVALLGKLRTLPFSCQSHVMLCLRADVTKTDMRVGAQHDDHPMHVGLAHPMHYEALSVIRLSYAYTCAYT